MKSEKLNVCLMISVVFNVLLLGIVVGHLLYFTNKDKIIITAPSEIPLEIKTAKDDVIKALQKDPYNKDEVLQAFSKLRTMTNEKQERLHNKIADDASKLPPKERHKLLTKKHAK